MEKLSDKGKKVNSSYMLTLNARGKVRYLAEEHNLTLSEVIEQLIEKYWKEHMKGGKDGDN